MSEERQVLTEFIELYRGLPCLWDLSCEEYKDPDQKSASWEILVEKLKSIDPNANVASAKQKIENLKASYKREVKKVKKSKNRTTGSSLSEVHKPSLWYYGLMTFLEKNNVVKRKGVDAPMSDDEDETQIDGSKRKKHTRESRERNIEQKTEKLIDAANNVSTTTTVSNAFGVYVGKKIEEIPLGQQRDLAEKLISDVIFLAKTNNLTFDTRIETPSRTLHCSSHNSAQSFYIHSPPPAPFSQSTRSSSAASPNSCQYIKIEPIPSPSSPDNTILHHLLKENNIA